MPTSLIKVGDLYISLDHLIQARWQAGSEGAEPSLNLVFAVSGGDAKNGLQPYNVYLSGKEAEAVKAGLDQGARANQDDVPY